MKALAIIPARGGSKRVPRKNLLPLAGKPMLAHSIEHARSSRRVERVVVSTEDPEIASLSEDCGAEVAPRPPELAGDTASSESALLHVLDHLRRTESYEPDLVVFLQCTSPVRAPGDIDGAVETLLREQADSLFSACRSHCFIWRKMGSSVEPLNYDYRRRPREQDMPEEYKENGSIFVFKPRVLRELGNRLGGKMAVYEMDYWSSFQVDSPEDLELCEWILKHRAARPR